MCFFSSFFCRISQYDYKNYLKGIQANSEFLSGTLEEMASELQRKFETLVVDDKDIYEKACKGMYIVYIVMSVSVACVLFSISLFIVLFGWSIGRLFSIFSTFTVNLCKLCILYTKQQHGICAREI